MRGVDPLSGSYQGHKRPAGRRGGGIGLPAPGRMGLGVRTERPGTWSSPIALIMRPPLPWGSPWPSPIARLWWWKVIAPKFPAWTVWLPWAGQLRETWSISSSKTAAAHSTDDRPEKASDGVDLHALAHAAGYPRTYRFEELEEFFIGLEDVLRQDGPTFVCLKVVHDWDVAGQSLRPMVESFGAVKNALAQEEVPIPRARILRRSQDGR